MPQYPTWRGIAAIKKYTLTTKSTKIHEKKANTVLSRDCRKDAEHTEEIQIHFTMKGMKLMKLTSGAPVA